jgi:hypothetical protein
VSSLSKKRIVYGLEVLSIAIVTVVAVYPTLLTLLAIASLPALVIGIIGFARPSYLEPLQLTGPRGGRRKYLHACGIVCALAILWVGAALGWSLMDGSLKIDQSAPSSSLSNPTLQLTASSLPLGCRS